MKRTIGIITTTYLAKLLFPSGEKSRMRLRRLMLLVSCFSVSFISVQCFAASPPLNPFKATYVAKFNGMPVEAQRELTKVGNGYRLSTSASNMLGQMNESEVFHLDAKGVIQLDEYHSQQNFFGINRAEDMVIDPAKGIARYTRKGKTTEIPLAPGYLGPVSYQLQLARDLAEQGTAYRYEVVNRGKVKDYQFEPVGEEVVDTAMGSIRALKLRRVRDNQERETVFWLAPDWNYLLIKLWQREEDGQSYELTLGTATVNGQSVSGKTEKSPRPTGQH